MNRDASLVQCSQILHVDSLWQYEFSHVFPATPSKAVQKVPQYLRRVFELDGLVAQTQNSVEFTMIDNGVVSRLGCSRFASRVLPRPQRPVPGQPKRPIHRINYEARQAPRSSLEARTHVFMRYPFIQKTYKNASNTLHQTLVLRPAPHRSS